MDHSKTALERAFELARSGRFTGVFELRMALKREGHNISQIEGPSLARQLRELMSKSRAVANDNTKRPS